jgi:uncharacterized protein (TIGR03435 family)
VIFLPQDPRLEAGITVQFKEVAREVGFMGNPDALRFQPLLSRRAWGRTPARAMLCLPILLLLPLAMAADHFDVASVKPAEMPGPVRRHLPGRIRFEGIGLVELITKAFALPRYQVVWPDWIPIGVRDHVPKEKPDFRFFTIDATMSPETSSAEFQLMLQNLLVERFGLAFHRETRQFAQYELTFAEGGPRMAKAKPKPESPIPGLPADNENLLDAAQHANPQSMSFGEEGMRVRGDYTVAELAPVFSNYLQHPLVDRTGSTEHYTIDITWGWNPYPQLVPGISNLASNGEARELFSVMEKKLGLKATLQSVPTEFLVIDRLSHEPTEN